MQFGWASAQLKCCHEYQHKETAIANNSDIPADSPKVVPGCHLTGGHRTGEPGTPFPAPSRQDRNKQQTETESPGSQWARRKGITAAGHMAAQGKLWLRGTGWDPQKDCNVYVTLFV